MALRRLFGENIALIGGLLTAPARHSPLIFRGAAPGPPAHPPPRETGPQTPPRPAR
jgi:hypothetical protein